MQIAAFDGKQAQSPLKGPRLSDWGTNRAQLRTQAIITEYINAQTGEEGCLKVKIGEGL